MLVGTAGCGKTTIYNILTEALSQVPGEKVQYRITKMNPKAITNQQMYGVMNPTTGEWLPGVFSQIWTTLNSKKNKNVNWINCDGPVDAIWIENLNTVLDDNKILTLANAERIPMSDLTKMTFEVENLDNASPATVSRCGIIYVSPTDLFWEPLITTWCQDRQDAKSYCNPEETNWMNDMINKYFEKTNLFKDLQKRFVYAMNTPEVVRITQLLNILTAILDGLDGIDRKSFEMYFVYCFTWAIGGLFEAEERQKFHKEILEKSGAPLPQISAQRQNFDKETVFDYFINQKTRTWELWEADKWTAPKKLFFSQLLIPTSDSTRAEYIMDKISHLPLHRSKPRKEFGLRNTLLVGGPGTAKTSVCMMYSHKFDVKEMLFKRFNYSSATTPMNFQESIESEIEKKTGRTHSPPGNKRMTIFLDDLSMPYINAWGDQVTLEITRQLIDQKGFYYLSKDDRGHLKSIDGLQFMAAMNHPGGGRNDIPSRLKRLFFSINMTPPSTRSIENIYGRILEEVFASAKKKDAYPSDVINMRNYLVEATIAVWETVSKRLLPTPAKFHYTFTIRELASVFGGICRVAYKSNFRVIHNVSKLKEKINPQLFLIGLWRHEVERTFIDKLTNLPDKKVFTDILNRITKEKFRDSLGFDDDQLMTQMLFADFQRKDEFNEYGELTMEAPFVYEAAPDVEGIRKVVNERLMAYNEKFASKKMDLVIFDDALYHLLKICRIINNPNGNALLVGVGGSGKQSLSKLSSFICKQYYFQIALTKSYNDNQLKEDIRQLYEQAGPMGNNVTFVMTDAEIKSETFLEAINAMLATGEIPGLIGKEDRDVMALNCKTQYVKDTGDKGGDPSPLFLWNFFINRVKDCLHMVLAFSPVGNKFRERSQKFPSLFSQCSIDWFLPWPEEALISVSNKFLSDYFIDCKKEIK